MAMKRTPRPRDPIQLGKLMVDIATGQVPDAVDDGKDVKLVERGRAGGLAGGKARSVNLTPVERSTIARKGGLARHRIKSDQS